MLLAEKLTWKEARDDLLSVNPALTKIIDNLDPKKNHLLVKVIYPFGSEILKDGEMRLPSEDGELVPFNNPQFDCDFKKLFAYNLGSNPVCVLLKNAVELFLELDDRVIPFSIARSGNVFGTWKVLEGKVSHCPATFVWGLTAGTRSIFMLPKVSEEGGYNRLRSKLGIAIDKARNSFDHWRVFREIVNSESFNSKWETELLFFSGEWFTHKEDKAWTDFNYYLVQTAWEGSSYWRNQFIWGVVFSIIQKKLSKLSIKPPMYIANLIKQLLAVGAGAALGFQPAMDNSLAPIKDLQDVFVNIYGLKHNAPIIMQPAVFKLYDLKSYPVYYSLQHPTSIEFAAKSSEKASTLSDLYYVRWYLQKYLDEILHGKFNIEATSLYDVAKNVKFTFYHSNTGGYKNKEINSSQLLFDDDPSFHLAVKNYENRDWPKNCNFFNGCVRIAHQEYL